MLKPRSLKLCDPDVAELIQYFNSHIHRTAHGGTLTGPPILKLDKSMTPAQMWSIMEDHVHSTQVGPSAPTPDTYKREWLRDHIHATSFGPTEGPLTPQLSCGPYS